MNNKTQEILEWYKHCIATGSICCATQSYYMNNYLWEYNEAVQMYGAEEFNNSFPEIEPLVFEYVE